MMPSRQVAQHPWQRLGDVLGDQTRTESRRRLAVQPSRSSGCIEGRHSLGNQPKSQSRQHVARPAVASHGGALPLMMAWPSGRAMTVSAPFSSTTAPAWAAAARACDSLSPSMPNNLLNSPACGVRRHRSCQRRKSSAECSANAVMASASITAALSDSSASSTRWRVAAEIPAPGPISTALRRGSAIRSANDPTLSSAVTMVPGSDAA